MINHVEFQGRLTADPQTFFSQKGTAIVSMSVAWNSQAPDSKPTFVTCKMFGKQGEHYGKLLHKGDLVFLYGRLQTDSFTGKDGKERSSLVIIIEAIIPSIVESSDNTAQASRPAEKKPEPTTAGRVEEDDVPF